VPLVDKTLLIVYPLSTPKEIAFSKVNPPRLTRAFCNPNDITVAIELVEALTFPILLAKDAAAASVPTFILLYPLDTARVEVSAFAGVFQLIPMADQVIGVDASAHVIGAVTSIHSYSSL
jgi:hypothetical protein